MYKNFEVKNLDASQYYSYNKYELVRVLLALFLCVIFLFPYIYYNLPLLELIPTDDSFYAVSENADFNYAKVGKNGNISFYGKLKEGELQLSPKASPGKNYRFLISTGNAVISAENAVISVICYEGTDGIYYTHVVCKKGHATLSLYDETESKVSLLNKYISANHEALIYKDEINNNIGFVRFEYDGTNPRPGHGVYTRETKTENDLFEYIEIDSMYYTAFLSSGKYLPPVWDKAIGDNDFLLRDPAPEYPIAEDSEVFTLCASDMYFSKYTPWGEEETVFEDNAEDLSLNTNSSFGFGLSTPQRDIVVNDNMKTLGGDVPLILNSLTIHENYPGNALQIIGEVRVKSITLIASTGKDESHLIKTDKEKKALPLNNYFKLSESGSLWII